MFLYQIQSIEVVKEAIELIYPMFDYPISTYMDSDT